MGQVVSHGPGELYWAPAGTDPGEPGAWTHLGRTESTITFRVSDTCSWQVGIPDGCRTFYLAICLGCEPPLPMPFYDPGERTEWAIGHKRGNPAHRILLAVQETHDHPPPEGT